MYRKIDTRIWSDAKIISMSHLAQLCFIYLLTHPSMTSIGAMRGTVDGLISELCSGGKGLPEDFLKAFREVSAKQLIKVDEKTCFIGIPNFIRYNKPESPNVVYGWKKIIGVIPECKAQDEHFKVVIRECLSMSKAFREALREVFGDVFWKAMANQEQEQEQDNIYIHQQVDGDKKNIKPLKENELEGGVGESPQMVIPPPPRRPPKPKADPAAVEAIYAAYPRRVGHGAAVKAIAKVIESGKSPEWLLDRVVKYSAKRQGEDLKFTPHPATWFNQGRYDDEDLEPRQTPAATPRFQRIDE